MKKFISVIMIVMMMLALMGTATVGATQSDIKLKISAYKIDGTKVEIGAYTQMDEGWNEAMKLAGDTEKVDENDYIYIAVDILDDWTATNGKFNTKDEYNSGFYTGSLYIPDKAYVVVNLNDHTIDRGLDEYKYNGEVFTIGRRSNVIINNGTITGGFSCNGAGGIHIHDEARVTLNYVSVTGNCTEDDNGAGIALYNGAVLKVTGGEISNNATYGSLGAFLADMLGFTRYINYGAGVYLKDASAYFSGVTFTKNRGFYDDEPEYVDGDVIAARNSTVEMVSCKIFENSLRGDHNDKTSNVFYLVDSNFTISSCDIYNNGAGRCNLFYASDSKINIKSSNIYSNAGTSLFTLFDSEIKMSNSKVNDNNAIAMRVYDSDCTGEIYTTTFNNNFREGGASFEFLEKLNNFYFSKCDFGNSTFENKDYAKYISPYTATILSNGSVAIFISLGAFALAVAALAFMIAIYKKNQKLLKKQNGEEK